VKKLFALPLLFALASCGTAGVRMAKTMAPAPLVIAQGSTVALGKAVPVVGGHPVMPGSVECVGLAPVVYVPDVARLAEIHAWTARVISADLDSGVLTTPVPIAEAKRLLRYIPAPRFYDRPNYGLYRYPDGTWKWGCAQGVSAYDGPQIAVDDPARTERLVCFERTNWYFGLIQRVDLWDSAATQRIEDLVGAQVAGGWRTQ